MLSHDDFRRCFLPIEPNKASLIDFLSKGPKEFHVDELYLPDDYQLLQSRNDNNIEIRLIHDDTIIYAINLEISDVIFNNQKPSVQFVAWVTWDDKYFGWKPYHEICKDVLFRFAEKVFKQLLNEFNFIIYQSKSRYRLWETRIGRSIEKELVYYTDTDDDPTLSDLKLISDDPMFVKLWFQYKKNYVYVILKKDSD